MTHEDLHYQGMEHGGWNHFYNDTFKFHACLTTKTGSTNWLKTLISLVRPGKAPEKLTKWDVWVTGLERFPFYPAQAKVFREGRGANDGYMTFLTVRHPLSRLYSAWKDKFNKQDSENKVTLQYIKSNYGQFMDLLEQQGIRNINQVKLRSNCTYIKGLIAIG